MRVAFIGIGTMGSWMALNAMKTGCEMVVHDLRREAARPHLAGGAKWADSPAEAAREADVVFTSLPKPADMEAVGLGEKGLFGAMRKGTAWFDLTTNSQSTVKRVAARFAEAGIHVLDAPVSGGPTGAKAGKLALYVGGDQAVFDRHIALLRAIADQAMHIGPIGAGIAAKLAHNCASFTIRMAFAEIFTLGVKAGVEPMSLWHAIRQGATGRRRTFDGMGDQFLPDQYEPPAFALELAFKDMTLALELAKELDVPMAMAELAYADMGEAMQRGWGKLDSRVPMKLQKERAGVEFKSTEEEIRKTLARD
jgi:3-hydroxyisobutyrate dehydrogenase